MIKKYGTLVRLKNINDAEASFKKLKDMGFSYCQLVFKPEKYVMEDAAFIKKAAENQKVKIVSLFAGYYDNFTKWDMYDDYKTAGINSKKYGKKRIEYVKSAALFAKKMGVDDVLIHAGFVANNPFSAEYKYMKKCVTNFAEFCKKIGANVILETGGESPVTLLRLIEDINLGNIYANLDTANLIMYGFGSPVEAVCTLNKHIRSMHIKDGVPPTEPNVLGKETPVGEGYVDFKRVFCELEKVGFCGPVIIEREIEGDKQIEDLQKAVKYLDTEIFGKQDKVVNYE